MRFLNDLVFNAVNGTTNPVSQPIPAQYLFAASLQANAVGSLNGVIKIQVCNDDGSPVTWSDLSNGSHTINTAGPHLIEKVDLAYNWIRIAYTHSSGTGTITARLQAQGN
jgi:hypothetical protein